MLIMIGFIVAVLYARWFIAGVNTITNCIVEMRKKKNV